MRPFSVSISQILAHILCVIQADSSLCAAELSVTHLHTSIRHADKTTEAQKLHRAQLRRRAAAGEETTAEPHLAAVFPRETGHVYPAPGAVCE